MKYKSIDDVHHDQSLAEKLPDDRYDLRILYALRRIIRAVDIDSRKLAAEHMITGPQLLCLNVILDRGPITLTGISKLVYLSTSTIVGIVDRLEGKGLVKRQRDLKDRRLVYVQGMPAGKDLATRTPNPLLYTLHKTLEMISEDEQKIFADTLERIVALMDTLRPESVKKVKDTHPLKE